MPAPSAKPIRLFSSDLDGTLLGNPEGARRFKTAWELLPARRRPLVAGGESDLDDALGGVGLGDHYQEPGRDHAGEVRCAAGRRDDGDVDRTAPAAAARISGGLH